MRKVAIVFWLLLMSAAAATSAAEIKPSDVAGKPDVYCRVVKEPSPALLGHYGCTHRTRNKATGEYVTEPVEYWLVKLGDQYGLYFHRVKDGRGKVYRGWRKWYLEGDRINSGESAEIFVKEGEVYYGWRSDKPTKMTRIE